MRRGVDAVCILFLLFRSLESQMMCAAPFTSMPFQYVNYNLFLSLIACAS